MSIILVLAVFGVGIWYFSKKYAEPTQTLVTKVKKIEKEIVAIADVNQDGKVDIKDVQSATEVVKKVRKPRKKTSPKKKKEL
jgi:hypothetical protein